VEKPVADNAVYQDLAFLRELLFIDRKTMRKTFTLVLLVLIFSLRGYGQTTQTQAGALNASALSHTVAHFDLTNSTLVEALSKLSLEPIAGLHLGIEEILRERFSDAPDRSHQALGESKQNRGLTEMGRQVAVVLYVVAMAAVIVGLDFAFFRNRFWERLAANIGIVLVFVAFYFRFLRRP
jgi:hypothetical protein